MPVWNVEELGAIIRKRRRQLDWDQRYLAERAHVSRQWIVEVAKPAGIAPRSGGCCAFWTRWISADGGRPGAGAVGAGDQAHQSASLVRRYRSRHGRHREEARSTTAMTLPSRRWCRWRAARRSRPPSNRVRPFRIARLCWPGTGASRAMCPVPAAACRAERGTGTFCGAGLLQPVDQAGFLDVRLVR